MKNTFKTILALTLSILMCLTFLVSCNKNKGENTETRVKISESQIQSKLAAEGGTLTIQGSSDDVTSFMMISKS